MKLNNVIESIASAFTFANALNGIATIATSPGEPGDVAAILQSCKRLHDQLAATQRMLLKEMANLTKANQKTSIMTEAGILDMLIKDHKLN